MTPLRRWTAAALLLAGGVATPAAIAQEIETGPDGRRYQVTRRTVQRTVPVTEMQDRQQTVYTQQLTTNTLNHQQLYCVPTTSYQWNSRLRGRWNPFVTPYWTHELRPVTSWSTQVANVQIPVNQLAWVPQTQTVQVPVTTYRTAEETTETRVALDESRTLASAKPLSSPSATIAARSATLQPIGGRIMTSDPPRVGTSVNGGWQSTTDSRYR